MFKTRFVFQSPPGDIGKNTMFIGEVLKQTDQAPESFTMSVHRDQEATTVNAHEKPQTLNTHLNP
jgi:hypothetical protein